MRVLDLFCGAGGAGEWKILEKMDVPEDEAKLTYRNYRAMNHYKNELRFMRYATYGE